jgi:hypothetical protein
MIQRKSARYIYIAGWRYCGSTMFEILLNGHPEIAAMGELKKFSLQFARTEDNATYAGLCSCGQRPMQCPIWSHVAHRIAGQYGVDMAKNPFGFRVSELGWEEDYGIRSLYHRFLRKYYRGWHYANYYRVPFLQRLSWLALQGQWPANTLFVADAIREIQNARAVVDASKDGVRMRYMHAACQGDLRVIYLTRGPKATVWSTIRRQAGTLQSGLAMYCKVNSRLLRLLNDLPAHDWIHIRHEDLCAEPERTVKRACDFLGYDYDARMLQLPLEGRHTIGGNGVRFRKLGRIRQSLAWRENLSHAAVQEIDRRTRPLAEKLGY